MATGATAVTVPLRIAQSPTDFLGLLVEQRVTVLGQVPSVFRSLVMAYENAGRPDLTRAQGRTVTWTAVTGRRRDGAPPSG